MPPRFRPPTPITIDNVNNTAAFLKQLQNMTKENLMGRIIGKGLRIYPKTPQAYHTIRSFIDREKLESYIYQLNEEKELKVVIRGMPSDMPPQQIIEGAHRTWSHNQRLPRHDKTEKLDYPCRSSSSPSQNESNKDVYNVTEICYMKIKIEPLDRKKAQPSASDARGFSTAPSSAPETPNV
ncbi:nucleic-acid-binding protein from transposon X-element [Trichonephila clavipes]|nr:nucleic-acid-binding protein from transposon X-element [Trichonephila clavipes]